ncbi:MAG: hypothetical protein L6Q95_03805 [Planctomycetes bacterium]|nr:hypothetical protein [Planctomycetota bacterium]
MSWFGGFFMGLFTRHLVTKILALLLSIGLFGFVQASLTATQEITRLVLVPSIAEEIRDKYVLLSRPFVVNGLTIRGEQSKVEGLARLYRSTDQRLPIDQRILRDYERNRSDTGVFEIPIDAKLFRDEVLFGKDVTVERIEAGKVIQVAEIATKPARVEVAAALQGLTHADYEGKLTFVPNMTAAEIRGPKHAFLKDTVRIVINVQKIGDRISAAANPIVGETGTLAIEGLCEIDWKQGDISSDLQEYLRITPEGGSPLPVTEFRQRLAVSCVVTKRQETITLPEIPIQIRYPMPQTFDLLEHYVMFTPWSDKEMSEGWVRNQLKVRLPAALRSDEAFLKSLVLVLDVATARDQTDLVGARGPKELGERLYVPFYLDVRDRARAEDLRSLHLEDEPEAQFNKKKP